MPRLPGLEDGDRPACFRDCPNVMASRFAHCRCRKQLPQPAPFHLGETLSPTSFVGRPPRLNLAAPAGNFTRSGNRFTRSDRGIQVNAHDTLPFNLPTFASDRTVSSPSGPSGAQTCKLRAKRTASCMDAWHSRPRLCQNRLTQPRAAVPRIESTIDIALGMANVCRNWACRRRDAQFPRRQTISQTGPRRLPRRLRWHLGLGWTPPGKCRSQD